MRVAICDDDHHQINIYESYIDKLINLGFSIDYDVFSSGEELSLIHIQLYPALHGVISWKNELAMSLSILLSRVRFTAIQAVTAVLQLRMGMNAILYLLLLQFCQRVTFPVVSCSSLVKKRFPWVRLSINCFKQQQDFQANRWRGNVSVCQEICHDET